MSFVRGSAAEIFSKSVFWAAITLSIALLAARFGNPLSSMGFNYADSSLFDEIVYSAVAVKMVGFPFIIEHDSVATLPIYSPIQNIASRIAFEILGVTYFSLRITGFVAYLGCLALAFAITKPMKFTTVERFAVVALLAADPGVWYFGGTNHPVIFQCLGILAFILVSVRMPDRVIVNGCVASIAFFLTYPPNAFLLLSGGLFYFLQRKTTHARRFRLCCLYGMGALLGLFFSEVAVFLAFGRMGIVEGIFWALNTYSGRTRVESVDLLTAFRGLSLLINPLILMLAFFSIGYAVHKILRHPDNCQHGLNILVVCVMSFILQALFLDDYPTRKMVVFSPVLTLLIVAVLADKQTSGRSQTYMFATIVFAGLAGLHEWWRHRAWSADFIDPVFVFSVMLIAGILIVSRYLPFIRGRLTSFEFVIPILVLVISCWVNVEVFTQMKESRLANRSLNELAALTADGCVFGYGHSLYPAGGGTPFFMPHIHGTSLIAEEIKSYAETPQCPSLYLIMDFEAEEEIEKIEHYGLNWTKLATMATDDIQNKYTLTLLKHTQ